MYSIRSQHKAAKRHMCLWCKEYINKEETYVLEQCVVENEHHRNRFHLKCDTALNLLDYDGATYWFDEGCPQMQRNHTHETGYTLDDCPACNAGLRC